MSPPLWEQLSREDRLILSAIYAFDATPGRDGANCRWVLAEALRQDGIWTEEVKESLSEYGYVEAPTPEMTRFDDALVGLACRARDGILLVEGLGNFGSPDGVHPPCHPMWRQCALTKQGEALLRMAQSDLPLVGSELTSAVRKLDERKARLFASTACRLLGSRVSGEIASGALAAIEEYANTGRTKAALRRWRASLRAEVKRLESLCEELKPPEAEIQSIVFLRAEMEPMERDTLEDQQDDLMYTVYALAAVGRAATERMHHLVAEDVAYAFALWSFGPPLRVCVSRDGSGSLLGIRKEIHGLYHDIAGFGSRSDRQ